MVFFHTPQFESYSFKSFRENRLHILANYYTIRSNRILTLFVRFFRGTDIHQLFEFKFRLLDQASYRVCFVFYVQVQSFVFFKKALFNSLLVHLFQILGQVCDLLQVLLYFLLQINVDWWKVSGAQQRTNRFYLDAIVRTTCFC